MAVTRQRLRLEINITQACNATCLDCNRAIGLVKFKGMHMSPDMLARYVDGLREEYQSKFNRIAIAGGEPLVHPQLQELIDIADSLSPATGWVLSNGMHPERRDVIRLPRQWQWKITPLDDLEDSQSGKSKHQPFFVSPADYGMEGSFSRCKVTRVCGKGLEAEGFTMCGVAGTLGRLLGINPYSKSFVSGESPEGICKHCVYGLTEKQRAKLIGGMPAGTVSSTYQRLLPSKTSRNHIHTPSKER